MTARLDLPDPVFQALGGERAARHVLAVIDAQTGSNDELYGQLRDRAAEVGIALPEAAWLQGAFRVLQKRIEGGA